MSKLLRGVTAQLLLLTVLPLTLILGVISFGSITMHQQAMRRLVSERDVRAAVATATTIGALLQHKTDLLTILAESAARTSPSTDVLVANTEWTDEYPGGIALYDAGGSLLTHSPAATWALGQPISGSVAFTLTSLTRLAPFTVTPLSRVIVWGDHLVLHAQDRTGRITAVGVLPVGVLQFNALVNPLNGSNALKAFLFDTTGRVLAHTQRSMDIANRDMHDHPGVAEALQGQSGGVFRPDTSSGEEHVVSYAPVVTSRGPTGLGVVLEEPWEAVLDPLMRYSLAMPLITLPVLLLAVLAVMFGLRRIVQPLQQLDQQAREIGHGQFAALRQPVHGIDEIQQLQDTLRAMADRIQADQEHLRGYANAVTETQEEERKRLARELHDDTIQSLIVLSQRIQSMRQVLAREPPQTAQNVQTVTRLDELRAMVLRMIEDVRRFSRALRPIYLEDAGLVAALERMAVEANTNVSNDSSNSSDVTAATVTFHTSGQVARLKPDVELALFRIAQEALANALRHAAPSHIAMTLDTLPEGIQLQVRDDGQGFVEPIANNAKGSSSDGNCLARDTVGPPDGFGLVGIRERALLMGARVEVQSAPGQGTCVTVIYPFNVSTE
jgi:two-component system sensor histidine kinase UhpB